MESLLAQLDDIPPVAPHSGPRVPILLPVALDQTYDYLVPEDLAGSAAICPGSFVLVPFGPQSRIGVVWDTPFGDAGKPVPDRKLRTVAAVLPEVPPLPILSTSRP